MTKKIFVAAALLVGCLALYACKSAEKKVSLPAGSYALDKAHSSLSATVMKNESIPVVLKFPKLDGGMTLSPLGAKISAGIDTLDTGNPVRDNNVRMLFFEVLTAANRTATFDLKKLEGDPGSLAEGQSLPMKGEGTLSLHGSTVQISGPLTVSKTAQGYSAEFKDAWTINIKDAGMLPQLANLSDACPQPHRVGLNVNLSGSLVFIRP
jgi:polyisoprenoid-binding protein YceI